MGQCTRGGIKGGGFLLQPDWFQLIGEFHFIGVCTDTCVIYQGFFSEIDEFSIVLRFTHIID